METDTISKKAKHIIWIVVDSMRSYRTGKDDRDKLDVAFEMGKESVDFENALTTAPSSIMSIAAMMSSLPSYYIGLNYLDFKFNTEIFPSFPAIWEKEGYDFKAFLNSFETRQVFRELLRPVSRKYHPKGISSYTKNWSNSEVNEVLCKYLKQNSGDKPTCFFLWYNIRHDPNTSNEVQSAIDMFKEKGLWDESFCILTSDHGYLDPKKNYTPEKLQEMGMSHDVFVTEDQIKIPLYIKYPDIQVKKITNMVSNLDLTPTLLDYFGLKYPEDSFLSAHGHNLLKLIDNQDRNNAFDDYWLRVDGRFIYQTGRITGIRNNKYKYVFNHDKRQEQFFDISEDFFEENDLLKNGDDISLKDIILDAKKHFKKTEEAANEFIIKITSEKFKKKMSSYFDRSSISSVALIRTCEPRYFSQFKSICEKIFPNAKLDTFEIGHFPVTKKRYNVSISVYDFNFKGQRKEISKDMKKIKANRKFVFDVNVDRVGIFDKIDFLVFLKLIREEIGRLVSTPSRIFNYTKWWKFFFKGIKKTITSLFTKKH